MKTFIFALCFIPIIAFACPNLDGVFSCVTSTEPNDGEATTVDITIVTDGDSFTLTDSELNVPVTWVANVPKVIAAAHTYDGDVVKTSELVCKDNKLILHMSQAWYHDLKLEEVTPDTVAAVERIIEQTFYIDNDGNLVQDEVYTKINSGKKYPDEITKTICKRKVK
jgi:hypothetical protein